MDQKFQYGSASVSDLEVTTDSVDKQGLPRVTSIRLNDEPLKPTRRFWKSFFTRFRISDAMFRYFSYEEVFGRVIQRTPSERFRYCIERRKKGTSKLLGVSAPDRPVIGHDDIQSVIERYDGTAVKYSEGVVTSTHIPASGDNEFRIGGDAFKNRFVLQTPIDGYGMPKIHLSLLRMVCTNGAIGYSKVFRTQINTGKQPLHSISRALDTYDNDNGYAALWQRFESAQNSWASVREAQTLYSLLLAIHNRRGFTREGILKRSTR